MKSPWLLSGILAGVTLTAAVPANSQRLEDEWLFQVSAYFPNVDSNLQVNANGGQIGTDIDLEEDLNFNGSATLPSFLVEWRPGDDWVLTGEYYALGRNSTRSIDREITVGDTVYPVNALVSAGFDSDVYRFTIGNRLFQSKNLEIGAAVGLHGTDFTVFIEGEGSAGGQSAQFRSENRSVFAPVPTIGLFLAAEPLPRVYATARIDWLSLNVGEYSGRLLNTEATVAYRVHRNIDIGATYRLVDYRVEVRRDDWNGRIDYRFSGPALFLQVGF